MLVFALEVAITLDTTIVLALRLVKLNADPLASRKVDLTNESNEPVEPFRFHTNTHVHLQ